MIRAHVRCDNARAGASALSHVHAQNHGVTDLSHLHACRSLHRKIFYVECWEFRPLCDKYYIPCLFCHEFITHALITIAQQGQRRSKRPVFASRFPEHCRGSGMVHWLQTTFAQWLDWLVKIQMTYGWNLSATWNGYQTTKTGNIIKRSP